MKHMQRSTCNEARATKHVQRSTPNEGDATKHMQQSTCNEALTTKHGNKSCATKHGQQSIRIRAHATKRAPLSMRYEIPNTKHMRRSTSNKNMWRSISNYAHAPSKYAEAHVTMHLDKAGAKIKEGGKVGSYLDNIKNKLGLSCAKLRPASLLRLLLLENLELCKCEKWSTSSEVNKVK